MRIESRRLRAERGIGQLLLTRQAVRDNGVGLIVNQQAGVNIGQLPLNFGGDEAGVEGDDDGPSAAEGMGESDEGRAIF